jgi:ATPase subunit of ABC transporter with duplicated ATPase domains
MERQQKLDARGKRKQEKAGVARIMMNTLRNSAENSTSKLRSTHTEKIDGISGELQALRNELPGVDKMKFGFDNTALHKGKVLFKANGINHAYNSKLLWHENMDLEITSGERIVIKGLNGSGKSTLIKIILGELEPTTGAVYRAGNKQVYIDQDYSVINNKYSVYEQALQYNRTALQEHEIKIRLNRFLFTKEDWDKPSSALSGGERMRLILCCLTIGNQAPDIIVLDEPTNNLDIQNIEILTAAINEYEGTLIVVSHDERFLAEINVVQTINV